MTAIEDYEQHNDYDQFGFKLRVINPLISLVMKPICFKDFFPQFMGKYSTPHATFRPPEDQR